MNEPSTNPYSAPGSLVSEPPFAETVQPQGRPWGPWATLGWTVVALVLMTVVQIAVGIPYVVGLMLLDQHTDLGALGQNGNFVSTIIIATTVAISGLVLLLCRVRHVPISMYLALKWPSARQAILWNQRKLEISRQICLLPTIHRRAYRSQALPGVLLQREMAPVLRTVEVLNCSTGASPLLFLICFQRSIQGTPRRSTRRGSSAAS